MCYRVGMTDFVVPRPFPEPLAELVATRFRVLGDPTRICLLDHLRDGARERLRRLARQAVDEVDVDALEAARARVGEERGGLLVMPVGHDDHLERVADRLHLQVVERPLWMRPAVTAGDGTTSLVATVLARRVNTMRT